MKKKVLLIIAAVLGCIVLLGIYKSKTIYNYYNVHYSIRQEAEIACLENMEIGGEKGIELCHKFAKCVANNTMKYIEIDVKYWHSFKYKYIGDEGKTSYNVTMNCVDKIVKEYE